MSILRMFIVFMLLLGAGVYFDSIYDQIVPVFGSLSCQIFGLGLIVGAIYAIAAPEQPSVNIQPY